MIGRAMKQTLQRALRNPWLDLAPVASALHPQAGVGARALDDWLDHFGIECAVRHQAAADTLATAELLLRLWPAARARQVDSFARLAALARHQRVADHALSAASGGLSRRESAPGGPPAARAGHGAACARSRRA